MKTYQEHNMLTKADEIFAGDVMAPDEIRVQRHQTRANATKASRKVALRGAVAALAIGALAPTMGPRIVNHVEQVIGGDQPAQPSRLQNEVEAQTAHNEAAQLAIEQIKSEQSK